MKQKSIKLNKEDLFDMFKLTISIQDKEIEKLKKEIKELEDELEWANARIEDLGEDLEWDE
jgi:prefoldin subunit 5